MSFYEEENFIPQKSDINDNNIKTIIPGSNCVTQ